MSNQICPTSTVTFFLHTLRQLSHSERAVRDRSYHKSQREHWGVSVPDCERLARTLSKELSEAAALQLAQALWETDLFDPMVCAAKILSSSKLQPSTALWKLIIEFLKKVDGWALEDHLAHIAWKCILADESRLNEVEAWTKHSNFWIRRAALIYTLPYAKSGRDPERVLEWASAYSFDSEWFIQKAIGWWLRVLGAHNPERVSIFLTTHWKQLKSVARKEAIRKLDTNWKDRILQAVKVSL